MSKIRSTPDENGRVITASPDMVTITDVRDPQFMGYQAFTVDPGFRHHLARVIAGGDFLVVKREHVDRWEQSARSRPEGGGLAATEMRDLLDGEV